MVALVREDARVLGEGFVVAALVDARALLAEATKRRSFDARRQAQVDAAEEFVEELSDALRHVPNLRTRSIVEECALLTRHLSIARPFIVRTPREDRHRADVIRQLAARSQLPEDVVKEFLLRPRTGPKTLARRLIGKKYAISEEQVRTLQKKYGQRYARRVPIIVLQAKRRVLK